MTETIHIEEPRRDASGEIRPGEFGRRVTVTTKPRDLGVVLRWARIEKVRKEKLQKSCKNGK